MAYATHSKFTVVSLQSASGVPTDISRYCTNAETSEDYADIEAYGFGAPAKEYITDFPEATFSFEGHNDPVIDTLLADISAAQNAGTIVSRTVVFGPYGSTAGKIKKTFEVLLTNYTDTHDIGDAVGFSAECRISGAIVRTLY